MAVFSFIFYFNFFRFISNNNNKKRRKRKKTKTEQNHTAARHKKVLCLHTSCCLQDEVKVKMNFQKNDYFLRWSTNGPQVSKNVCSALERILSIWIIFVISLSHFLKHGGFWGFSSPEESSSLQRPYQALASVVPQMNNRKSTLSTQTEPALFHLATCSHFLSGSGF